jgi:nitrate reductase gamma subunit
MDALIILLILVWASYVYIAGTYAYRSMKYARMPVHLRWELYPVPHEGAGDSAGSYLQESEWWTKPRHRSLLRDIGFIAKDYLTFAQYFRLNRGYWSVLYLWHLGFYLILLFHGLVAIGALAQIAGVDIAAESANGGIKFLYYLTIVTGVAGFGLGCLGSIGVFVSRRTDDDLHAFASIKNYFSYAFYFTVFASGLVSFAVDPNFAVYRDFYQAVFTLDGAVHVDAALVTHAVLFAAFLFYMPSTQAMHYATKFFSFFAIRWNDAPNVRGSKTEKKIEALLGQPVTWSAPHIRGRGNWVDVATSEVEVEVRAE